MVDPRICRSAVEYIIKQSFALGDARGQSWKSFLEFRGSFRHYQSVTPSSICDWLNATRNETAQIDAPQVAERAKFNRITNPPNAGPSRILNHHVRFLAPSVRAILGRVENGASDTMPNILGTTGSPLSAVITDEPKIT